MRQTYKAVMKFQKYQPGDEFTASLDPDLERRAIGRGQIKIVPAKKKEEAQKDG